MEAEAFNNLPRETLSEIFSFVPFEKADWMNVKLTCKKWSLIADEVFDPNKCGALERMIDQGIESRVIEFLQNPRVNPAENDNEAIKLASANGMVNVVDHLLKNPKVDPSSDNNISVRWASIRGHLNVVNRLLKDPRVDPSDNQNSAYLLSKRAGKTEIIARLMEDPRVQKSHNS